MPPSIHLNQDLHNHPLEKGRGRGRINSSERRSAALVSQWPPPLALNRRPQASSDPSAVRARASAAAAAAAAPVDLSSAWLAMRSRADSRSHSAAERGTAGARSGDGCRRGASLPSAAWTLGFGCRLRRASFGVGFGFGLGCDLGTRVRVRVRVHLGAPLVSSAHTGAGRLPGGALGRRGRA